MKVVVHLFAALKERAGAARLVVEDLPEPLDLGGLKAELERRRPELGSLQRVAGAIGTDYVRDDHAVGEGDEVYLLPPVSGGCDASGDDVERGVFELVTASLDVGRAVERVRAPHCGGIATFLGTTRDHHRGRGVVRLDYEAYEAMTGPEMARIFERCRASCGPGSAADDIDRRLRMYCAHRIGSVAIGEASVVVCVASPHRDAAFRACRFLIDALKETLPVWKKEVYTDGEQWIGEGA